ncbi:guanine deaminase isoform X2 [Xenopus tropicalis]|uniref:Guanine deaminase n=1 Tax=Xenopus tropicalis TaxID=8364 RepID=A0A8J1IMG2_XENTR|nr:guanine deaminase isoform X2 [Xenopus tropicalis]
MSNGGPRKPYTGGWQHWKKHAEKEAQLALKWKFDESKIEDLGKNEFFMPGMIDTHIHAPQYSFIGSGMDRPLLQWLEHITFPTEEKFSDLDLASNIYETVVRRTLKNGTTTACYFATIHTDASLVLADIADRYGQRAFIGKVCMDSNTAYPEYIESTEESIAETQRFVEAMQNMKYDRVKPIITPRFAVSCSERLLCELGRLADSYGLHIQSHISESVAEIQEVLNLFPEYNNYTEVYSKNKLLTNMTVMAHGCYLTDEELHLFRSNGSAISHCPNSNISLCSGHLDVSNVIKQKVKVGLGTDIAGGYSISMLDAIRKAIETSKILFMEREKRRKESKTIHNHLQEENGMLPEKECNCRIKNNGKKVLSDQEAFRLATLGGSQALNIDHITGNFEINKEFDALLISPEIHNSPFDVFSQFSKEDMVQRFLYLGDDRNIKAVYVAGRRVVPFQNNS